MLEELVDSFMKKSLKQKILFFKQAIMEFCLLCMGALIFFWSTFGFLAIITLFISPEAYYHEFSPIYHVRQLRPDSLFTLFVNQNLQ